jgi:hypothetical protein
MSYVLATCAVVLAACADRPGSPDPVAPIEVAAFPAVPDHDVDLLIVVDDTTDAEAMQGLADQIGVLYNLLGTLDPPTYDLDLGVVSADLGTTGALDPAHPAPPTGGCAGVGDDGVLRTSPHVTGRFLHDARLPDGSHVTNFIGSPLVAISELLAPGASACAFPQPVRAIQRALTQPLNAGFSRSSASLGVVVIEDHDDCSIADATMFDPSAAALGPLDPFRCAAQGLACDQGVGSAGMKSGCVAREDSPYVIPVGPFAQQLAAIKDDPRKLAVATITGPTSPVVVEASAGTLALGDACSYRDLSSRTVGAAPAVRDRSLLAALPRGVTTAATTLCQEDLAPALRDVAHALERMLGDPCVDTGALHDDDELTPGIQPFCGVEDVRDSDPTRPVVIPRCPAGGADCFDLVADARVCPDSLDHLRVVVIRATESAPDTWTHVRCAPR